MSSISVNEGALEKTSRHVAAEIDQTLQVAADRVAEARNAGNNRSRGYASLVVVVTGLLFQGGGILAIGKLAPARENTKQAAQVMFSPAETAVVRANFARIDDNLAQILVMKNKIAPSMPIDGNVSAIGASSKDLRALITTREREPEEHQK